MNLDWKQYEDETTSDLIQYIRWKDQPDYIEASKSAFVAFCFRYRNDIVRKCEIICNRRKYDIDVAIELANRTFNKFWLNPNYDDSKRKNAKTFDEGVKFYLYGIANKELINIYRENTTPNPYSGEEEIIWDFPDNIGDLNPVRKKELEERREIIEMALSSLSNKHKPIYLTYIIHGQDGKNLPKHLLNSMREEFGLAQATIRFYYFEAKKKIEDYLKIWDKATKK